MQASHSNEDPPLPSARATLRQATDGVHEAVHDLALMRRLADGTLTRPEYHDLTTRLLSYYTIVDARVTDACDRLAVPATAYAYVPRAPLLLADLTALVGPATPPRLDADPPADRLPPLASLPELAGAAYVVEGSLLGAKLLARALPARTVGPDARRFWTWCAEAGPERWAKTRSFIEAACPLAPDRGAAVATAARHFALFHALLSRQRHACPT